MSSVASNLVATMMNSQIGSKQTTSSNLSSQDNGFKAILNRKNGYQTLERKEFDAVSRARKSNEAKRSEIDPQEKHDSLKPKEVKVDDVDSKKTDKKIKEVTGDSTKGKKIESEDGKELSADELKVEKGLEEQVQEIESSIVEMLGELLGVDVETLNTMLTDMNMSPTDLMEMKNLTQVVSEAFGIEDLSELLTHDEASQMIKSADVKLKDLMADFAKEMDVEVETLQSIIGETAAIVQSGEVATVVEAKSSVVSSENEMVVDETADNESVKLEVVDERTDANTTKYSQDNTGKEEQSFAGLLSSNAEMTKEVVVVNNDQQVVYKQVSANEVINQIVTKAVVNLSDEKTTMQLQLNPEHLGKIGVSVTAEQGIIKGQFIAENQVVKEMIESNLVQLKDQLEEQGIKVDKIEVTIGNSNQFFEGHKQQQEQGNQSKSNRRRISRLTKLRNISEVVDALNDEPQTSQPIDELSEYTVDYSA